MTELLSMLVPLETLPGWPPAPNPPVLATLGLLIGLPALVAAVIVGVSQLSALAKRGRGEQASVGDSAWVGSTPPGLEGSDSPAALSAGSSGLPSGEQSSETGGAGGRW